MKSSDVLQNENSASSQTPKSQRQRINQSRLIRLACRVGHLTRYSLLFLSMFLPQILKQAFYRRCLGWKIGRNVKIGLSFIDAAHVELGDGALIGNFNLIRRLKRFIMKPHAKIKHMNQFSGWPSAEWGEQGHASSFELGEAANIQNCHYFDVSHLIQIGEHSVFAGNGSSSWTHGLQFVPAGLRVVVAEVRLGRWVYVGAKSTLFGCDIADGYMIGAGSVVCRSFPPAEYHTLIAGNPAVVRKHYDQKVSVLLPDTKALWKSEVSPEGQS